MSKTSKILFAIATVCVVASIVGFVSGSTSGGIGGLVVAAVLGFIGYIKREQDDEQVGVSTSVQMQSRNEDPLNEYEQWMAAREKYGRYADQHFKNIERIKTMYSIAINLTDINGPEMQQCIDLCKKDIGLAALLKEYWKTATHCKELPNYYSFSRLAIIYEKQKKYDAAIAVCQQAIAMGYISDDSDGNMPGRLARLVRKQRQQNERLTK